MLLDTSWVPCAASCTLRATDSWLLPELTDLVADFARRLRGLLCQSLDLGCYHGEAPARAAAGTRGLAWPGGGALIRALFMASCARSGIPSGWVEGYTATLGGVRDFILPILPELFLAKETQSD